MPIKINMHTFAFVFKEKRQAVIADKQANKQTVAHA